MPPALCLVDIDVMFSFSLYSRNFRFSFFISSFTQSSFSHVLLVCIVSFTGFYCGLYHFNSWWSDRMKDVILVFHACWDLLCVLIWGWLWSTDGVGCGSLGSPLGIRGLKARCNNGWKCQQEWVPYLEMRARAWAIEWAELMADSRGPYLEKGWKADY